MKPGGQREFTKDLAELGKAEAMRLLRKLLAEEHKHPRGLIDEFLCQPNLTHPRSLWTCCSLLPLPYAEQAEAQRFKH